MTVADTVSNSRFEAQLQKLTEQVAKLGADQLKPTGSEATSIWSKDPTVKSIARSAYWHKHRQNREISDQFKSTGTAHLVYRDSDPFWGVVLTSVLQM